MIAALTDVVARYPRWGFWKCFDRLRVEGRPWNHKHVHRVYCALRLNLPRRTTRRVPRRVRQPLAAPPVLNQTWALNFMSETLYDGRRVRLLTVIDEGNREGLEIAMGLSVPSRRVVRVLDELVAIHGYPSALRTACYDQVVKALGAVGLSNRGTDTGTGSGEPAHRASSGLIPEERRVPGGRTSSWLRFEGLRTTVGMASSPARAGASGFRGAEEAPQRLGSDRIVPPHVVRVERCSVVDDGERVVQQLRHADSDRLHRGQGARDALDQALVVGFESPVVAYGR